MKVYEFHFNPPKKEDIIFDTFYYEPEDAYEKRLGCLFMLGELKSVLKSNERLLKNLARVLKTKFYSFKTTSVHSSLKKCLKAGNEFLQEIAEQGDVSWLANLNFAILALTSVASAKRKKYKLNFTKTGEAKIFLLRQGNVLDIAKGLDLKEIEPYPVKAFTNVLEGKIQEDDRILVLTPDIYKTFNQLGLIEKIARLNKISEKFLNNFFGRIKMQGYGACLLIDLQKIETQRQADQKRKIIFKEKLRLGKPLTGLFAGLNGLQKRFKQSAGDVIRNALKNVRDVIPNIRILNVSFKSMDIIGKKRNVVLVISFVGLLALGGFYAKIDEKRKIEQTKNFLIEIEEKTTEAKSFMALKENARANNILLNIWQEISNLTKAKNPLMAQILTKKQDIEQTLFELNNLEKIEEPELIFEFSAYGGPAVDGKTKEFLPQKIAFFDGKIYFFSPYLENIYQLDKTGNLDRLEAGAKFKQAISSDGLILFISTSNQFFPLKDKNLGMPFSLVLPSQDFEFESAESFKSNIYLLEKNNSKIVKYPYLGEQRWGFPEIWFENKNCENNSCPASSLAIDGSVWVLKKENSIEKYYAHKLEKTIRPNIFPIVQEFTKIWAFPTLPYLYILEPAQKRIIVLDKTGKIIKQYQSEKFDNLKDFVVSLDGKEIYILNNQKLFRITPDF